MIRQGQIVFNKSTYYPFDVPDGYLPAVKLGEKIKLGEQLVVLDKKMETVFVEGFGDVKVQIGDVVKPNDVLCIKKGLLKNESIRSEVDGTIVSINKNVIEIRVYDPETKLSGVHTQSPFQADIEQINMGKVLLRFPAIQLNLLASRGVSAIGDLVYIEEKDLFKKSKTSKFLDSSILIAKSASTSLYSKVSALGANGLIVGSMDFEVFKKSSVLEVPLGVIHGFKDLIEDETLVEWFKSIEGRRVWFDAELNRLVIPFEVCPHWIKTKI